MHTHITITITNFYKYIRLTIALRSREYALVYEADWWLHKHCTPSIEVDAAASAVVVAATVVHDI